MELAEITVKQRKLLKLVVTGEIDKGYIYNEFGEQIGEDLIAKATAKHVAKRVAAIADDLK